MPIDALRWVVALDTGWTLEYIDSLSEEDFMGYLGYRQGQSKAMKPAGRK